MANITPTGGVKGAVGGYNYSTDKSQNILFNQGEDVTSPGATQNNYDYSAKGRAARMYKMTGNSPASTSPVQYGTDLNVKLKKARITRALN